MLYKEFYMIKISTMASERYIHNFIQFYVIKI